MKRIILFLVIIVCSACKSTQHYYLPAFLEHNMHAEQEYTIDYERVNEPMCHVVDSMVGHFYGHKRCATLVDRETDPRIFITTFVRLDLDADGVSFFSESLEFYKAICSGVWCMTDSMIQITCNTNHEIADTLMYLISPGVNIYGAIDVKVLDRNRLLLKNGTVLYRTENENTLRKRRGY